MQDFLREKGWPEYKRASHVELKYAMMMWKGNIKDGRLFINNEPCTTGDGNCDTILPLVMPPGSSLKIYGPNGFEKVYRAAKEEE